MRVFTFVLCSLLVSIPPGTHGFAQDSSAVLIHAGNLLAVPGEAPQTNQTLVIQADTIAGIHGGFHSASSIGLESARVIELKEAFVLPGFIDMHTHLTGDRYLDQNRHAWLTKSPVDMAFESLPALKRTLLAGFTTVRNVGAPHQVIMGLKKAVDQRVIPGPRIIPATGYVSPTGGAGDLHGYRTEVLDAFDDPVGLCDGPDDCRRAVRAMVKQGAEVIKVLVTGAVLSEGKAGVGQQFTDAELQAIVETAEMLGRKVAAHAHGAEGVKAALRAGVHSIEHGTFLDAEAIQLFKDTNAYLVPTLLAGESLQEEMEVNDDIPQPIRDKLATVMKESESSFQRALEANVRIAFGTDSGVSKHGDNAREFSLLVDRGLSPMDAIKAATVHAADLLGMPGQVGSIAPGKYADMVAVHGNPLEDISVLQEVRFVMQAGEVYRSAME